MVESFKKSTANKKPQRGQGCLRAFFITGAVLVASVVFIYFHSREQMRRNGILQDARAINLLLFTYAQDNDGKYPEGRTSTEVFQKLIDGGYVSDKNSEVAPAGPAIFYFPMPGKVKPTSQTLKPENVCWDVTAGLNEKSPHDTPIFFQTGYKATYTAGASAVPSNWPSRTWWEWLTAVDYPRGYIVVGYKEDGNRVLKAAEGEPIPDFVPMDFTGNNQLYRQLTPDGTLP